MSEKKDDDAIPTTALAELTAAAKQRLRDKPDIESPAAIRTMAAIVRDLKGMPEIVVTRDGAARIKIGRRGKVGAISVTFDARVRYLEVEYEDFPGMTPTSTKMYRYMFAAERGTTGEWHRIDEGGELIEDVRTALLRLYPELA